ncbi:MAG: hypothetical protein HXY20_09815 [Acidobacteria bacterium]|nr:hypothetical protein [Acidobacteriota bacterium]
MGLLLCFMKGRYVGWALAGLLGAAGVVGILSASPHGIGLSPDSIVYVGGARNILAGNGFSMPPGNEPITHHAPLYPLVLAILGFGGLEPVQGARFLGALLFGLNILLIYKLATHVVGERTPIPAWIPIGVSGFTLFARPMWEIHLMAWSEPMFISLCLATVCVMAGYVRTLRRSWLLAGGLSISLSILTRYAGLSMWAACCLIVLFTGDRPIRRRLSDTFAFSDVSLAPFALWVGRNILAGGAATERSLVFHPIGPDHLREALVTAASWLLVPAQARGWTKAAALALVGAGMAAGIYLVFRQEHKNTSRAFLAVVPPVVKVAGICAAVYVLFLAFSISFVDGNIPLDQRILSPLFVMLLLCIAYGFYMWDQATGKPRVARALSAVLISAAILGNLESSSSLFKQSYIQGLGLNNLHWHHSELIRKLRELQVPGKIYSNSPPAIYYHAGKGASKIPVPFSKVTRRPNPYHQLQLSAMYKDMDHGGLLVLFDLGSIDSTLDAAGLVRDLKLSPFAVYADGAMYTR